ncbi:MAG: hypothetical protein WBA77_17385 [Microcoleaceae cyanobacterium]
MEKRKHSKHLESVRDKILNSYLTTIEESFQENRSQLKLINYGTGSGKTHQLFQAICETIKKYPDNQIVGIYVAPLIAHLSVPTSVKEQYKDIPVYKLNSLDMKMTDEYIKFYKQCIPSILKNSDLWDKAFKLSAQEKVEDYQQKLKRVPGLISRLDYFKTMYFGDEEFKKSEILKAKREFNSLFESFLEFIIKYELHQYYCKKELLKLIEIFFPLYLLREKSGILMLTYKKFETKIPYFKHNNETWIKKSEYLDQYVIQCKNKSNKFIFAFDEQEDGYQIILDEKIDIISPEALAINNALSSIIREFSILFSKKSKENRKLLKFLDQNKGAYHQLQEYIDKDKKIESQLQQYAPEYQRLTSEEGNSIEFLQEAISINKGLEKSLEEIVAIFDDYNEENPIELNFEMLARVLAKFENTKSLLIPQTLYNKISDELMNIFSYNNLYIYNIESLRNLFLSKYPGGHVYIDEGKVSDQTSVAELIYTILAMRSQIKNIKEILKNVIDAKNAEDSQSRSLDIWSQQISKVQRANEEEKNITENKKTKYLNRDYVYESNKSIINIKEISRYKKLINPQLKEVSIGSTAIFTSPEYKINSILENSSNIIFLISATGGITGDLTTSYDLCYLEDKLRDELGKTALKPMNSSEIELCEEIRKYRQENREITVSFFNPDASSFPNDKTQAVVERFKDTILQNFINEIKQNQTWFSNYKIQELTKFIHFLFYLFEDDSIQEMIAFTQTLRWIKELIDDCSNINHDNFIFTKSEQHPNIYYVKVHHKKYQSNITIKLILYKASFDKDYYDKTIQRTYLDELVEEEGQKILFISAYQSASKGLNPIITTKNGEEKDFDSLVLLMDSFYTVINSIPKNSQDKTPEKSTTQYHFALMKSIVSLGDSNLEIKDFNQYLSQPEASHFRQQQHQILLGKGILQAIGRTERRDFPNQAIKIFINEETRENLIQLYNYLERKEPNEIRKLSVNNYAVYLNVREEEKKRSIPDYQEHIYDQIDAELAFQEFRETLLNEIELFHQKQNTFNIKKVWDALRDPIAFKDPQKYLNKLRKLKEIPDEFIDSLFYHNSEQFKFTPHLASVEEDGKKFQIISDSINGEKRYDYQKRLYPEYLKMNSKSYDLAGNEIEVLNSSSDSIYKLYNQLIPKPEVFNTYIPRRYFLYDMLYPSFTENFVQRWIEDIIFPGKDWKVRKDSYGFEPLSDFKEYSKLYEKFDLYYIKDHVLFCIDVKAWSKSSGNRLSSETLEKAKKKLKAIAEDYPEFRVVKGLLLNLHASKEKNDRHSSTLSSGNLIYFDSRNYPVESTILRDFLLNK